MYVFYLINLYVYLFSLFDLFIVLVLCLLALVIRMFVFAVWGCCFTLCFLFRFFACVC